MSTRFLCQTYRLVEKGKGKSARPVLVQDTLIECDNAGAAEARAHKMWNGGSHAGVDAYSVVIDADMGDYSAPEFIVRLGEVPPSED